jgi:hypothetical protein
MQEQRVIFLHVPKAAGSSLQRILDYQYKPTNTFSISRSRTVEEFKQLPRERREKIRLLKGHMYFGLHEFLPSPSTYITVLRDPVDRIISLYYFVLQSPHHSHHKLVTSQNMSLEDYFYSGRKRQLNNGQTRLLSGIDSTVIDFGQCSTAMLESAKKNLQEHFLVFGITERFDETLILMKRALGWKNPFYVKHNVTKDRPSKENVSRDILDLIKKYNELDIELYNYAKKMFEERISQQGDSFEKELSMFQHLNKVYRPYIRIASFAHSVRQKIASSV